MQVGDLVKDITGVIGIVIYVDNNTTPQWAQTTFGWVRKVNLEKL